MSVIPFSTPPERRPLDVVFVRQSRLSPADVMVSFSRPLTADELDQFREICERSAPLMDLDSGDPGLPF